MKRTIKLIIISLLLVASSCAQSRTEITRSQLDTAVQELTGLTEEQKEKFTPSEWDNYNKITMPFQIPNTGFPRSSLEDEYKDYLALFDELGVHPNLIVKAAQGKDDLSDVELIVAVRGARMAKEEIDRELGNKR